MSFTVNAYLITVLHKNRENEIWRKKKHHRTLQTCPPFVSTLKQLDISWNQWSKTCNDSKNMKNVFVNLDIAAYIQFDYLMRTNRIKNSRTKRYTEVTYSFYIIFVVFFYIWSYYTIIDNNFRVGNKLNARMSENFEWIRVTERNPWRFNAATDDVRPHLVANEWAQMNWHISFLSNFRAVWTKIESKKKNRSDNFRDNRQWWSFSDGGMEKNRCINQKWRLEMKEATE